MNSEQDPVAFPEPASYGDREMGFAAEAVSASEWLHRLVADWQLLADLSFADLVLWEPDGAGWRAVAQVRPTTGPSVFRADLVGSSPRSSWMSAIRRAAAGHDLARTDAVTIEGEPTHLDVVPVRRDGRTLALLSRHTRFANVRRRGRLESTYIGLAGSLLKMVASGAFPDGGAAGDELRGAPRVGDGVIALDAMRRVTYASPNAVSALKRLGLDQDAAGLHLEPDLLASGVDLGPAPEVASAVLAGAAPWSLEVRRLGVVITIRAVPLVDMGEHQGAVLLLRDVSELRRRERELLTKDATIREVHHRVKNNLQTVAALLRLQARRLPDEQARRALADAGRRVGTIASVHESLSEGLHDGLGDWVNFDDVAQRILWGSLEVAGTSEHRVEGKITGQFGVIADENATSLALILAELVQNAVEHGLRDRDGEVVIQVDREGDTMRVEVRDNGRGFMPLVGQGAEGSASSTKKDDDQAAPSGSGHGRGKAGSGAVRVGLGTQIVRTFVADLGGAISWHQASPSGTSVTFTARLNTPPQ